MNKTSKRNARIQIGKLKLTKLGRAKLFCRAMIGQQKRLEMRESKAAHLNQ